VTRFITSVAASMVAILVVAGCSPASTPSEAAAALPIARADDAGPEVIGADDIDQYVPAHGDARIRARWHVAGWLDARRLDLLAFG
jgi:hypothetical protein